MKKILEKLFDHNYLEYEESKKVLKEISSKKYNYSQVASFLTVFKMRNPSVQEIEGFRDALLDLCVKIDLSSDFETIDLCGTGGDGKNTFNISTISSFVVAGAGYKVTKHGNFGVSPNISTDSGSIFRSHPNGSGPEKLGIVPPKKISLLSRCQMMMIT